MERKKVKHPQMRFQLPLGKWKGFWLASGAALCLTKIDGVDEFGVGFR